MIPADIIARFRLQVDDSSELSDAEELDLLNEVYIDDVCGDRQWYWLRKPGGYSGTSTTSGGVTYVTLPTDFGDIVITKDNEQKVFVGTARKEFKVIPFSQKDDYRNVDNFCYIDMVNRKIYFCLAFTANDTVVYDYVITPTELALDTVEPLLPFAHRMLAYGMAAKWNPIEQSNKLTSYRTENLIEFNSKLADLQLDDAEKKVAYN